MDREPVTPSCGDCAYFAAGVGTPGHCDGCGSGYTHWIPKAPKAKSAFESQVGGAHYTNCAIQPFEYSMANKLDPMQHTIVKYVTRFRTKNGIEDLKKARHTIDLLIEWEEKHGTETSQAD